MYKNNNKRFGIVMHQVMTDPSLTIQAKGLYSLLSCYADKDRECFPSLSTLADTLNVTPDTVSRYIRELKAHNYIKRVGRKLIII
jgi:DNA-binding MarR family transcriptional regulator|tara:strand:+ start:1700 stop:1954 length:255 start_codon:yes stop_codon:yes gene_type:complete